MSANGAARHRQGETQRKTGGEQSIVRVEGQLLMVAIIRDVTEREKERSISAPSVRKP